MRKVLVVTGTRAEFGLLKPLIQAIESSEKCELSLAVTGTHLSNDFGYTLNEILASGFKADYKIDIDIQAQGTQSILNSMSLAIKGFGEVLSDSRPDMMVVLGDRYEIFAAAQSAMFSGVPLVHIHGGEVTEGAFDESIRHSITKMANIHFCAAQEFKNRILQMGENPLYTFMTGAIGVDALLMSPRLSKKSLEDTMPGFTFGAMNFLVTHHPVTKDMDNGIQEFKDLLASLDSFPEAKLIITYPNSDTGGSLFLEILKEYCQGKEDRIFLTSSLGHQRYISCLEHVDVVIGNSSSGIIEVPYFKKPTVNIGQRQKGRLQGKTVINVDGNREDITKGIRLSLSSEFRENLDEVENLYGSGNSVNVMIDIIEKIELKKTLRNKFFDYERSNGEC